MAHAARRLNEDTRPAKPRGAHLRVVEPPAERAKTAKRVPKKSAKSSTKRPAASPGRGAPAKDGVRKAARGTAKPAAPNRQAGSAKKTRGRAAAARKPRSAAWSASGLIAGATQAIMPEQRADTALAANCRMVFRLFMVGLFVVSAFGMARVTLSAQAAATSVAAMKMKSELRAARQQSESLEIDRGALAQPSRIESVAAGLRMGRPADVRYIALPKALAVPAASAAAGSGGVSSLRVPDSLKGVLDAAARITANEAQVLLASGSGLGVGR